MKMNINPKMGFHNKKGGRFNIRIALLVALAAVLISGSYGGAGVHDSYAQSGGGSEGGLKQAGVSPADTPVGGTFTALTTEGVTVTYKVTVSPAVGTHGKVEAGDGSNAAIDPDYAGTVTLPQTVQDSGGDDYDVVAISNYAFRNCKLTGIVIPATVKAIYDSAFQSSKLQGPVVIPDSVTSISQRAFNNCADITSVSLPSSLNQSYVFDRFSYCGNLTEFTVSGSGSNLKAVAGVLFSGDDKILVAYPSGKTAESYIIPSGTENIPNYAFFSNTALKDVTVPASVTAVGYYSFNAPLLTTVNFLGSTPPTFYNGDVFLAGSPVTVNVPYGKVSAYESAMGAAKKANLTLQEDAVCEIGGVPYATFDAALAAVPTGGATPTIIKLLRNISIMGNKTFASAEYTITNKKITLNLNGFNFNLVSNVGGGIDVNGSELDYIGDGEFKVNTRYTALNVRNGGYCKLTYVINSSSSYYALTADGTGSRVIVNGDVAGPLAQAGAISAGNGASVTVNGDAMAGKGIFASAATVELNGALNGTIICNNGDVTVNGAVKDLITCNGGNVTVNGEVSTLYGRAVIANSGGKVKVNGAIDASRNDPANTEYVQIDGVDIAEGNVTTPTTLSGYYTYTNGASTIWVKDNTPGGGTPGGETPGGDKPGGDKPGGDKPGGDKPGGDKPGGGTQNSTAQALNLAALPASALTIADKTWTGKRIAGGLTLTLRYSANGKAVTKKLREGTDYTLSSAGANKNIGKATVTVSGKTGSSYTGARKLNFNIVPKTPTKVKLTQGKKSLKVKWTKSAKFKAQKIGGYEIQFRYKAGKKWSKWKMKTYKISYKAKAKTLTKYLKRLKGNKQYQVQIRSWKKTGGVKYYSAWTKVKAKKTQA